MAKKILVVEDDKDTQFGMKLRLEANGYEVCFASDAVTAIQVARKQSPDLVLLDLGLPGGDGFVVMERLKRFQDLSMIPVVVLTAQTGSGPRERSIREGAKAFFTKPVKNADLLDTIATLTGGYAPEPAVQS